MMVIFLVGLVSMILMRTLRKDYARYSKDDDIDEMVSGTGLVIATIIGMLLCWFSPEFHFFLDFMDFIHFFFLN